MILTEDNLQEWKEQLNRLAYEQLDGFEGYSYRLVDAIWLFDFEGLTPQQAIDMIEEAKPY